MRCRDRILHLDSTRIMGVINLTTDSFYQGSRTRSIDQALTTAQQMTKDGADIIDLGAMSSRPGAQITSSQQELEILLPVIDQLSSQDGILISVDTIHADTAKQCLEAGAHIINDITGGDYDSEMLHTVHHHHGGYVMMHMRGTPASMIDLNDYPKGVTMGVLKELRDRLNKASQLGMDNIIVDPGFGFAKNIEQNFTLLKELGALHVLDHPILIGVSRKSMIWKTLQITPDESLNGTTALHAMALQHHPHILRVHDVLEAKQAVTLFNLTHNKSR